MGEVLRASGGGAVAIRWDQTRRALSYPARVRPLPAALFLLWGGSRTKVLQEDEVLDPAAVRLEGACERRRRGRRAYGDDRPGLNVIAWLASGQLTFYPV